MAVRPMSTDSISVRVHSPSSWTPISHITYVGYTSGNSQLMNSAKIHSRHDQAATYTRARHCHWDPICIFHYSFFVNLGHPGWCLWMGPEAKIGVERSELPRGYCTPTWSFGPDGVVQVGLLCLQVMPNTDQQTLPPTSPTRYHIPLYLQRICFPNGNHRPSPITRLHSGRSPYYVRRSYIRREQARR